MLAMFEILLFVVLCLFSALIFVDFAIVSTIKLVEFVRENNRANVKSYAKCVAAYCKNRERCDGCKFLDNDGNCMFSDKLPYEWFGGGENV